MRLKSLVEFLWPPVINENYLEVARKRAIIAFCLPAGVLGCLLSIGILIYSLAGFPPPEKASMYINNAVFTFFGTVAFLAAPYLIHRNKNIDHLVLGYCAYAFVLLFILAAQSGGIISFEAVFMLPLVMTVTLALGLRYGALFSLATIGAYIILFSARHMITESFATGAMLESLSSWLLIVLSAITCFIYIGTAIFQREMRNAATSLEKAQANAKAASRAKSEFLANMSHEIRTPMNGVLGMAELLKTTELSEKQTMFADTIYNSGSALLTIINDILDFSKIEAGKLQLDPTPFHIKSAIEDVATLLGTAAREKEIELIVRYDPGMPETAEGDVGRIRQILTNLVGNAIKFTLEGYVLIDVKSVVEDNTIKLHIDVQDTGIGIEKDKVDTVFEQFTQAEGSTTRKYGGTGLGLSITRSLVEAMGGLIGATSTLGKGSVFWFEIDLPIVDAVPVTPERQVSLDGVRILIVDDLDINRNILSEQLENWGAEPTAVECGADALEALRQAAEDQTPFALLLTDFHMPEMDGLEFVRHIRNDPSIAQTKVLVLSSVDNNTVAKEFKSLNVTEFMTKPVRSSLLLKAVSEAITDVKIDTLRTIADEQKQAFDQKPSAKEIEDSDDGKAQVLIAEDNLVNRMVIENMLDPAMIKPTFAEDGMGAYKAFQGQTFDLIFMDISMPIMDGVEATKAIRAMELSHELTKTPIIALTAHAMTGDKERFLDAGMDDYVTKPVKKEKIDAIFEKWGLFIDKLDKTGS